MCKTGLKPNPETYNTLARGFYQSGDSVTAQKLLDEMKSIGLAHTLPTYNIELQMLCGDGKFDRALVLLDSMEKSKMIMNIIPYNIVIDGLFSAGKVEDAWKFFFCLTSKGITPGTVNYNTIISGLCKNGFYKKADLIFNTIKEIGPLLDDATFNILIRAKLDIVGKDETVAAAAYHLFQEMRCSGFPLDASTTRLVCKMLSDGDLDETLFKGITEVLTV